MKYIDWLQNWLDDYVRPCVKPRTLERYEVVVRNHIRKDIGTLEIAELSPLVLQKFVTKLMSCGNCRTGEGLAPNSINSVIAVLQGSLKTACAVGVASEFAAGQIKRPRTREKTIECFSLPEQKKIESSALGSKKSKMIGVFLCLYSGLRIGELLALQWSDIDFKKGTLSVSKSCHDGKNGRVVDEPKTRSSVRTIPLPKQLLPMLKIAKKNSDSPFVVSSGGKPVSVRSYQRSFELMLKKLGIPHRGFHSLRHTFATRALECGMDVKTLSEILGHKDPSITLKRYVHSLMEHKREMMNRLGKLL